MISPSVIYLKKKTPRIESMKKISIRRPNTFNSDVIDIVIV